MRYIEYKLNDHIWIFQNTWLAILPSLDIFRDMTIQFEWLFWGICIYKNKTEL